MAVGGEEGEEGEEDGGPVGDGVVEEVVHLGQAPEVRQGCKRWPRWSR